MPIVAACIAMEKAIDKASKTGIAISTVKNSGHFGAAGYYANLAAQAGCIGISMCNVDPGVAAPGSCGPVLGTNPFSYAVPGPDGRTIFLDVATSIVAASKVYQAKALGKQIPEGWLVGGDGLPTTDPSRYPLEGALMPMAGHKGYGIALMVELLTGVLSGGAFGDEVVSWLHGPTPVNQSLTFVAVNVGSFMDLSVFTSRAATLAEQIRHAPKSVDADRIYTPGELEWDHRERVLREGVALPPDAVENLVALAEEFALDLAGSVGGTG
jgi:ureidoglycolate dehydrogenase (NAD+)